MTDAVMSTGGVAARTLGARGSRALVGSADPAAELTPTAAAVLAAIPAWWSARATQAGLTGDWLDVHWALQTEPPLLLSDAPPLELEWGPLTPEAVGAAYVDALSPQTRARHGRHYTPRDLAGELWAMARRALGFKAPLQRLPGLVRDPACGAGALLLPALREHIAASIRSGVRPEAILRELPNLIHGVDSDPAAVWVANVVLAGELLTLQASVSNDLRRPFPLLAETGDGLSTSSPPARVVVMNPPYGRVRLSAEDRRRFENSLYGHANLYGLFMAAAVESLDQTGVLAALVPTSFTAGRYFEPLRRLLANASRLQEITFVADRSGVFTSVLQETCLATFTRRKIRRTTVNSIGSRSTYVATVATPTSGRPWVLPRRSDLAPIAASAAALPLSVSTAGWAVSTGPLVWNRRRADLHARGGKERYVVIWAADIDGGLLHRDPARSTMRFMSVTTPSDRKTMLTSEPRILVQRTTAPEQLRRLVAVELTQEDLDKVGGSVVVENHVNVLRPSGAPLLLSAGLLTRLLATTTLDKLVRCISGSVALSAYELESLALPGAEVLKRWEELSVTDLETAVAEVYGSPSRMDT